MRRFISILAMNACLLAGCTTTRTIRRPETPDQLEAMVWKKRSHITLLSGVSEGARLAVPASPAVLRGAPDPDAGVPLVQLSTLRGYEVKRRGLGALEGLAIGTALGFAAGALVGLAVGGTGECHNDDGGCVSFTSSDMALFFGLIGAVAGHATGPLIGAAIGHTDRYVFSDDADRR